MRPVALLRPLLPALALALAPALAGCCCERPCAPRCEAYGRMDAMPESSSPGASPPLALASPADTQAPAPALPSPAPAPLPLKIYEVRDFVAAAGGNARLLAELKPVLPADAQAFTQGEATIVVKTTAAGQQAAGRWLGDRRRAVTPVLQAHAVFDLTASTPIDVLIEDLRAALPPGTVVNQQGTGTLVIKATPAAHKRVQQWLEDRRQRAAAPK